MLEKFGTGSQNIGKETQENFRDTWEIVQENIEEIGCKKIFFKGI